MDRNERALMDAFATWWKSATAAPPPAQRTAPMDAFKAGFAAGIEHEPATPWVVIDAGDQVLRCLHCKETHPLADGINHRPIWFAAAIMRGFAHEHRECEE